MGRGGFVPTNPDLADILGRTYLDFENIFVSFVLFCMCLDFQTPVPAPDELSDPNLTPLPMYQGTRAPCDVFDPWVCWERGQVGI